MKADNRNDVDMWVVQLIGSTSVVFPLNDLYSHDKLNTQCRCSPEVQMLENGFLLISHNMIMGGWFIPTSGK